MLVGREEERRRIQQMLERARTGLGSSLALVGEPGIGKTALLDEAVRCANGMTVLATHGQVAEVTLPFSGLLGFLRPVNGRIDHLPAAQRGALATALALGARPATQPSRLAVNAATLSLLADVAADHPVLALIDDAHLLDASSLDAILFAALRLDADPVAVLFAERQGEHSALEDSSIDRIEIGGLRVEEAATLVGDAVAPNVVRSLVEATGGNPLALLELRATLDGDSLAGLIPLEEPLPVGRKIGEWFGRRVAALPKRARDVLIVAAVCGGEDLALVKRTAHLSGLNLDDLEPAEAGGLVTLAAGHLEFCHPLLRSAIYQKAGPVTRRRVHGAVAAVLVGIDPDGRALHLAAAATGPDEESATALLDVVDRAIGRGAALTAARIAERAAGLTPDSELRARRLRLAAELSCDAGRLDPAITLLDQALGLARDPALRAEICWYLGGVNLGRGLFSEGFRALVEGADLLESIDPAQAATLLRWAMPVLHMRLDARAILACTERVAALVNRGKPTTDVLDTAQEERGAALTLAGRAAQGIPLMLEVAGAIDPIHGRYPAGVLHEALVWVEEYDAARSILERCISSYRVAGVTVSALLSDLADLEYRTGRWARAMSLLGESLAIAEHAGQTKQLALALSRLAMLEATLGKESDCRNHLDELRRRGGESSELPIFRCRTEMALGLLDLGAGRVDVTIEHLESVADVMRSCEVREPGVLWWAADLIQAYVQAGRTPDAERELNAFAELADESKRTWALAATARCRGLLASRDDAERHFLDALGWHARTPTPFEAARTRLCYGQVLRRDGRRVAAREQLRAALTVFESLGAQAWVEQARKELRASGEVLRRRRGAAAPGELTPQEAQIAFLIAEGATNKEAAARLFLSPKTIENHLSRIYRKLDVRTRTELAHHLASDGQTAEMSTPPFSAPNARLAPTSQDAH